MPIKSPDPEAEFTMDAAASVNAVARSRQASMQKTTRRPTAAVIAGMTLLAGGVALYYFWTRATPPAPQIAPAPTATAPAPEAPAKPAIAHPVEQIPAVAEADAPAPLPKLDESDVVARDSIASFLDGSAWMRLLVPGGIIRQIVATVDNLPRKSVATRILPVKPVPGTFETTRTANEISIAPANAARYTAYVKAAEAIDAVRLAGFYVRLYPLFQQAYVELGYPNGYFNDRLVEVIDHLLAAPEPRAPVKLAQPKVLYQFADPELQERSAGQKIMMRVGVANEVRLKAKLREIRKALATEAPKP